MRITKKSLATAVQRIVPLLSLSVIAGLIVTPTASAAESNQSFTHAPDQQHQHCVIMLSEPDAETRVVTVESQRCYKSEPKLRLASDTRLLMQWYEDKDFEGAGTAVLGHAGMCDARGYRLFVAPPWNILISSFQTFNWCNGVRAYKEAKQKGASQYYYGDPNNPRYSVAWVGAWMNDTIGSFQIWSRRDRL